VIFDQAPSHPLGSFGGVGVTFGGLDDRAFHQDVPRARELFWLAQTCLLGESLHDGADVRYVLDACLTGGAGGAQLEEHVDERACFEVLAVKPLSNRSKIASSCCSAVSPRALA
jgi:hypothetical protein